MQISTNSCSSYTLCNRHWRFPKNDVCPFFCLLLCKLMPNGNDFLVSMEVLTAKASDYVVQHSHGSWLEHHEPQSCQHVAPILHPRTTCKQPQTSLNLFGSRLGQLHCEAHLLWHGKIAAFNCICTKTCGVVFLLIWPLVR